jgi:transposase
MKQKRRRFSKEFKKQVIEEVQSGLIKPAEAFRKYEINSATFYQWKVRYELGKLDNEPTKEGAHLNRIAELERKVGQQAMEIDLLKKLREIRLREEKEKRFAPVILVGSKGGAKR